jgi:hypothetical protein
LEFYRVPGELLFPVVSLFLMTYLIREMCEKQHTAGICDGMYPYKHLDNAVIPCIFPCAWRIAIRQAQAMQKTLDEPLVAWLNVLKRKAES